MHCHLVSVALILPILFWSCSEDISDKSRKDTHILSEILERFNIPNDEFTKVRYLTIKEHRQEIRQLTTDSQEIEEILKINWPNPNEKRVKNIFRVSSNDTSLKNGLFIEFSGSGSDTSLYTIGYYKNGLKDSIWTERHETGKIIQKYKDGKRYGKREGFFKNGRRSFIGSAFDKAGHDTLRSWYKNGQLFEFEIFKDGKSILYECYDSLGNKQQCPGG